jgi:hypothetical protein
MMHSEGDTPESPLMYCAAPSGAVGTTAAVATGLPLAITVKFRVGTGIRTSSVRESAIGLNATIPNPAAVCVCVCVCVCVSSQLAAQSTCQTCRPSRTHLSAFLLHTQYSAAPKPQGGMGGGRVLPQEKARRSPGFSFSVNMHFVSLISRQCARVVVLGAMPSTVLRAVPATSSASVYLFT